MSEVQPQRPALVPLVSLRNQPAASAPSAIVGLVPSRAWALAFRRILRAHSFLWSRGARKPSPVRAPPSTTLLKRRQKPDAEPPAGDRTAPRSESRAGRGTRRVGDARPARDRLEFRRYSSGTGAWRPCSRRHTRGRGSRSRRHAGDARTHSSVQRHSSCDPAVSSA